MNRIVWRSAYQTTHGKYALHPWRRSARWRYSCPPRLRESKGLYCNCRINDCRFPRLVEHSKSCFVFSLVLKNNRIGLPGSWLIYATKFWFCHSENETSYYDTLLYTNLRGISIHTQKISQKNSRYFWISIKQVCQKYHFQKISGWMCFVVPFSFFGRISGCFSIKSAMYLCLNQNLVAPHHYPEPLELTAVFRPGCYNVCPC